MVERGLQTYFGTRRSWAGNCLFWLGPTVLPTAIQADLRGAFGIKGGRVVPVPLERLDGAMLADLSPRGVVSTLFWPGGDALDAAQRLAALGFRGPYRALTTELPDAGLIVGEVRALFPGLDFSVMELRAGAPLSEEFLN